MYWKYERLRNMAHLTDYKVAKAAGIGQSTLSDWKHGRSKPKFDKLKKIADALGVPVSVFAEPTEPDEFNNIVITDQEKELIYLFRNLSYNGRDAAIHVLAGFQSVPEYAKKKIDSSKVG